MFKHSLTLAGLLVLVSTAAFAHGEADAHGTDCAHGGAVTVAETEMTAGHAVTAGDLEITGAFTRATLPNAPVAGGYLTISNSGATDDRLISVTTPIAGNAQVHEMKMEGDVMKMNELPDGLVIPAGGSVALEPGGYHLMFLQLTRPLVEGESIPVTLTFEKAGAVEVQLQVGSPAAKAPAMDHSTHSELVTVRPGDLA